MITPAVLIIACAIALAVGIGIGQYWADLKRARGDASRIMRTRSNYRRSKGNQK